VYRAFLAGGAPKTEARAAAEAIAGYENRLGRIEDDLALLKWLVGFNLALTVVLIDEALLP
jgi:hypothetical protein